MGRSSALKGYVFSLWKKLVDGNKLVKVAFSTKTKRAKGKIPPRRWPNNVKEHLVVTNPFTYFLSHKLSKSVLEHKEDYVFISCALRACIHGKRGDYNPVTSETKRQRRSPNGCLSLLVKQGIQDFNWLEKNWPKLTPRHKSILPLVHCAALWEDQYANHALDNETFGEYVGTTKLMYEDFCENDLPRLFPPKEERTTATMGELMVWKSLNNTEKRNVYMVLQLFEKKTPNPVGGKGPLVKEQVEGKELVEGKVPAVKEPLGDIFILDVKVVKVVPVDAAGEPCEDVYDFDGIAVEYDTPIHLF